jgi:hypothetical protein
MIELIFAIVVIGIAVMTLPTMNQATTSGIEGNLVQEAVFAASTELNQAVTANWDDNSLEPGTPDSLARVIELINGSCDNNTSSATYRQMLGHVNQPYHRRCLDSNSTGLATVEVANVTSLDNMTKTNDSLANATTDKTGYKLAFTTTVAVTNSNVIFGTDQANANPNMKKITVTIKDTESIPNIITELVTYSANIGEIDYYKRSY